MANLERVKEMRGMPFLKKGMRVFFTYSKKWGTITGANASANIDVRFDDEKHSSNCHPKWMMQYYDDQGKVIAEYKG